ncbi:zinc finger protein neuro-d4 isoform X3 [Nilaparvata lugens]|uniref:zinc finger protein neuro-d4 isoform X3 n=1 Tax=Nilaparvata lugens TaxID=108931 RepID=UPI00193DC207|nr:zinc finger protein neuro-d4 isoform X3 [Nilaparvata lugens]
MACDIQVVNQSVLSRIESFMNDSAYRETIENSANFNTRLCIERRLRMPFLDPQTGLAQNHSNLFMSARQRLPGLSQGQVYSYPSKRWRKKRRQYLMNMMQPLQRRKETAEMQPEAADVIMPVMADGGGGGVAGGVMGGAAVGAGPLSAANEDSKDSSGHKEEAAPKVTVTDEPWYYDELDLHAMDGFDEPDPDSDYDYEEPYPKRKKKRAVFGKPRGGNLAAPTDSPHPRKPKAQGPGRGRKKGMVYADLTDADKPFACDQCGARYKTRPGLTYHYTHSHKEQGTGRGAVAGAGGSVGGAAGDEEASSEALPPPSPSNAPNVQDKGTDPAAAQGKETVIKRKRFKGGSSKKMKHNAAGSSGHSIPPSVGSEDSSQSSNPAFDKKPFEEPMPVLTMEQNEKERAAPSPYCDFCLGDAEINKKSGQPEELVSCSDCGRSGHPTCLQFTSNMIISVRKYRWQCIECKCCSVCGTSDNDDQLLFCDDCDRGYHMYCLAPPLSSPPEGSWSCRLCISVFHSK